MNAHIQMGVIGTGRIGRVHAENLASRIPGAKVLAVADPSFESARKCAQDFNIPHAYSDYHGIIEDPAIETVVICSPTETHVAIIEDACRAGKHIFCEKPVAITLEEMDKIAADVETAGIRFQVGFNRRFDPTFLAMRKSIVEGHVGEPQILKITSRDPYPPSKEFLLASGGMFMVTTIHDFDMARYLTGSEVKRISAVGRVLIEPYIREVGTVDTAVVTLEFENGALGIIDNSWQAVYGYDQRVEVFGSKGMVMSENQTPHRMVHAHAQAVQTALPVHFFMERYTESYVNEMNAFVTAIRENSESPVTVQDARISLLMALAAEKSCAEERSVTLAEVDTVLLQYQA